MIQLQLPLVTEEYDKNVIQQLVDYIDLFERLVFMQGQNVEVFGQADSAGRSPDLILRSPDGTRWAIRVDNSGVISATSL